MWEEVEEEEEEEEERVGLKDRWFCSKLRHEKVAKSVILIKLVQEKKKITNENRTTILLVKSCLSEFNLKVFFFQKNTLLLIISLH